MSQAKKVNVVQVEEQEIPLDILATHIRDISDMGKKIKASRLKQRVIELLIKDMTGISFSDISRVLDALPQLEKQYLK